METRVIKLTESAFKYGNLNLRCCGEDFFPPDVFGGPNKKSGLGNPITLKVEGLDKEIKTDIPTDEKNHKPRWIFRERGWLKAYIRENHLVTGDTLTISRASQRTYQVVRHQKKLTFIDLFAGIGGTRIAFEKAGCECVFSSEWNKFAQQTYEANFGEKPHGDIREIPSDKIPDHDILVTGFPCQS